MGNDANTNKSRGRGNTVFSKHTNRIDPPAGDWRATRRELGQVPEKQMNIHDFHRRAVASENLLVTCYDYWSAQLLNDTDLDTLLVGDSPAMVMHGFAARCTPRHR